MQSKEIDQHARRLEHRTTTIIYVARGTSSCPRFAERRFWRPGTHSRQVVRCHPMETLEHLDADSETDAISDIQPVQNVTTNVRQMDDVAEHPDSQQLPSVGVEELGLYLCESKVSCDADPYDWWKKNESRFPKLAQLARRCLSASASSVDEERVFSCTGKTISG